MACTLGEDLDDLASSTSTVGACGRSSASSVTIRGIGRGGGLDRIFDRYAELCPGSGLGTEQKAWCPTGRCQSPWQGPKSRNAGGTPVSLEAITSSMVRRGTLLKIRSNSSWAAARSTCRCALDRQARCLPGAPAARYLGCAAPSGELRAVCEPRALRPRDLRRRRGDGRRVPHVRPLRAVAAQGDGDHPRCCCPPRRGASPVAPAPGAAAADGQMGVVPTALGAPRAPRSHLRTRMSALRGATKLTLTTDNTARYEHARPWGLDAVSRSKSLTPRDAAAALTGGELQLIDVREPVELGEARVKGASHIPAARRTEHRADRTRSWSAPLARRLGAPRVPSDRSRDHRTDAGTGRLSACSRAAEHRPDSGHQLTW